MERSKFLLEALAEVEPKKSRRELKQTYWMNLVKEFERSGLSEKEFVQLHGIKRSTFYKWKIRCEGTDFEGSLKNKLPVKFLPLELSEPMQSEGRSSEDKIVFRHGSGFTLELEEKSNKELFRCGLLLLQELSRC